MGLVANRLLLVGLIVVAGYLAWQHQSKLFENKGRLAVSVRGKTAFMFWNHDIKLPMARRITEAYERDGSQVTRFILVLDSPGGALHEGGEVIEVLQKIKTTHQLHTFVGPNSNCLSMCVPIYLQGQKRLAAPESRWMFHEPISVDPHTGEQVKQLEFEANFYARRFFERYFTNSEMAPAWRKQLERDWKGKEIWKTGQQLFDEGANIITQLVQPKQLTL